jgi:hypothetical protein
MKRWKWIATLATLAMVVPMSSTVAAHASAPSAAAPKDTGIGTKAALDSPNCDPTTGQIKFPHPFGVPECVAPLKAGASNGGATSQGVTKDSIKVVTLLPPEGATLTDAIKVTNQATGQPGDIKQAIEDTAAVFFDTAFEKWGRTPDFEFVTSSGTDEAAQRADAVKVAAMKPFIVFDYFGEPVFSKAMAASKVITFSLTASVTDTTALSPYLWRPATGFDTLVSNTAELVCKGLKGKKAQWAGDDDLKSKARKFGYVYDASSTAVNTELFTDAIKKCGATATGYSYEGTTDSTQALNVAQDAMKSLVPKMKNDGITSVVLFNASFQGSRAATEEATSQDWNPEWLVTGIGYSDIDVVARMFDQKQMAHAFGVAGLIPAVAADSSTPSTTTYQWYWGTDKGTIGVWPWGLTENLAIGIHNAGPKLTPETFKAGMFSLPPQGGAASKQITTVQMAFGRGAKLPYDLYMWGGDYALVWWDPTVTGDSNVVAVNGQGKYVWLDGAQRYQAGQLAKGEPTFFSMDDAIVSLETRPESDVGKDYPCDGCPSTGA